MCDSVSVFRVQANPGLVSDVLCQFQEPDSPMTRVLAMQPRIPESLMIDDEDVDHVPHKDIPESQDDEFARSVRVRDAARGAFIVVDTDHVSGRQSSRVTKVPLAKLHKVFKFMESLSVMERNRKRRKVK